MARPTDYNKEVLVKSKKYIEGGFKKDEAVPTVAGLADYLGVVKKTVYNWADEHEEFLHFVGKVMTSQEKKLLFGGLTNKLNAKIVALMLSKHGYKEQLGLSGEEEGSPIKIETDVKDTIDKIYDKPDTAGEQSQSS